MDLLKQLCSIHSPSGEELYMKEFLLNYVYANKNKWKIEPTVYHGEEFQDCLILVFGKPKAAVFAHMDTVGFTVRYGNELIKIGSPAILNNQLLRGYVGGKEIECTLKFDETEHRLYYESDSYLPPGTSLSYKTKFSNDGDIIISNGLDNRIGIWNALNLAKIMEHGIIVFSAWEELGGGSVEFLTKFIYDNYKIKKVLISDVTWESENIHVDNGVVISLRDISIPRRSYVDSIIDIAAHNAIKYQLEIEDSGGSDGTVIQNSPYPIDWCFVGVSASNVHSPIEVASMEDMKDLNNLYIILMKKFHLV